ncbi:MAG TPA: DNA polymerase III subunit beta, partial [Gammaproteobacteria bacterium]|nr:DNA polymerase III subunit beta [Gammaproteobacteria bacterium]
SVDASADGDVTVPGRKLHEICRAVPEGTTVEVGLNGERLTVKAGRSRFTLSTLRAADFPVVEEIAAKQTLRLGRSDLRSLIQKTHFSMAQQDVRYYLNGLLLETDRKKLRAVATDGHRLALSEVDLEAPAARDEQVIVPRKGVLELNRLLEGDGDVAVAIGSNHVRVQIDDVRLTSKLIDGRFPEYARVIPNQPRNIVSANRNLLREALQRTAILSNEKYRGVRLELSANTVVLQANNPEQEEAVETLEVEYGGDAMEIGFNVNYLLDALAAVETEQVELGVSDANSSCLIREPGVERTKFVVMPMRL